MKTKRTVLAAVLLGLSLVMGACAPSTLIGSLHLAVDTVAAALPVIGGMIGAPADVVSKVETYLSDTNTALSSAAEIIAGPGTSAEKAAKIAAAFAAIPIPDVSPQYGALAQLVVDVAGRVASFLANLPQNNRSVRSLPAAGKLSNAERNELDRCRETAAQNAAKLRAIMKR